MNRPQTLIQVRTIDLGEQQMMMLDYGAGARLQVLAGGVWLTEPDAWDDRFARSGGRVRLRAGGRARVAAPAWARLRAWQAAARRWGPALRSAWLQAKGRLVASTLAGSLALIAGLGLLELTADGLLSDSAATAAQVLAGPSAAVARRSAGS